MDTLLIKATTESGVEYIIDDRKVTGGSFNLQDGYLVSAVILGRPLRIRTAERVRHNPHFTDPGVTSTRVTKMELIERPQKLGG